MPTDTAYYKSRWKLAKVDFKLSYGMFLDGKLIGVVIHAIDDFNGSKVAFNTGTGVVPAYRGQRIITSIYKYAIVDLKKNGIVKCSLEVITENQIAIKLYKSLGFKICKYYECYQGKINLMRDKKLILKKVDYSNLDWENLPNQNLYSWDNQSKIIVNGNYSYYQVIKADKLIAYFVINPTNGYLAQFDVLLRNNENWKHLFAAIKSISSTIKVNNIEKQCVEKIDFINSIDLKKTVEQYEMEMKI